MDRVEKSSRRQSSALGAGGSILDPRCFTRSGLRCLGLVHDRGEQISETAPGSAVAGRQLGHFGEAQLRVGERQASQGLGGRRQQMIELVLVADFDAALLEQLELAVESTQADAELRKDHGSRPGRARKESNQAMQTSSSLQGDVNGWSASGVRLASHTQSLRCVRSIGL
jgi:hypothetical protein